MISPAESRGADQAIAIHSEQADLFADRYESLAERPYGTCFGYSRMRLDRLLLPRLTGLGEGVDLLDVGCGTGDHMARLAARGFHVAGIDGSSEMLRHARARNPTAQIAHAEVDRLPFGDGEFDATLCIEVLRYLPDPRPCIREMARVLRPGGVCLATAIPYANLNGYVVVNRLTSRMPVLGMTPLRQYFTTVSRLEHQFADAGFTESRIRSVYFGPINWIERLTSPSALSTFLHRWEPIDDRLARRPRLRNCANMLLVAAKRAA